MLKLKDFPPLNLSQSDCKTKSQSGSLSQYSNYTGPESEEQEQLCGYRLIDMNLMSDAMVNVHKRKKGKLLLREYYKERYRLKSSLCVECSSCKKRAFLPTSKNITDKGKSYDINRRAVFASLELSIGFNGLETFCAHLDLKCLGDISYYKQLKTILNIIEKDTLEEMKSADLQLWKVL